MRMSDKLEAVMAEWEWITWSNARFFETSARLIGQIVEGAKDGRDDISSTT
jgi:hypothetical protein